MLRHLDAGMERRRRIIGQHGHAFLRDDLAGIHARVDVMHGAAGDGLPRLQRLLPGLKPGEFRQKGRVDIDDAAREGVERGRLDHAHVTREDHEIDSGILQRADEPLLHLGGKTGAKLRLHDFLRAQSGVGGILQNARPGNIGEHDRHLGVDLAGLDGFKDGPELEPFSEPRMPRRILDIAGGDDACPPPTCKRCFPRNSIRASSAANEPGHVSARSLEDGRCRIEPLPPRATTKPATLHKAMRYSIFAGASACGPFLLSPPPRPAEGKSRTPCMPPARSSACTPTRSFTTTCPAWMTTISAAAARPRTRSSARDRRPHGRRARDPAFDILAQAKETPRYKIRDYILELSGAAGSLYLIAVRWPTWRRGQEIHPLGTALHP